MPRSLISVIAIATLLAACSTVPKKTESMSTSGTQATTTPSESDAEKVQRIADALANKSIYFDYDKFDIKSEYQSTLQQDAKALTAIPNTAIRVEGNADERGSAEYNLALGQKRAEAVKRALQILGIPESQLEAVSFGKEKPRATCHEEKCWSENRRVDFSLKKP